MSIYKFTDHDRVPNEAPECRMKELFKKCQDGTITKEEKQQVFDSCQSNNGIYKLSGWAFNFREFMKRYVVRRYDSNQWETEYAFSRTNIKRNDYTKDDINEIYEIPKL